MCICEAPNKHDIDLAQLAFPPGSHICYIYTDEAERREFVTRFIAGGFASGEKVAYLTDEPLTQDAVRDFLAGLGIVEPCGHTGQFFLAEAEPTYCPDGLFQPERILNTWRALYRQTRNEQFPGLRVTGETTWLRKDLPGLDRWFEYEARLNWMVDECPFDGILCQYDAHRLDGASLYEVLNVHPLMVVRGQITHNPFYEPPEHYLARHG